MVAEAMDEESMVRQMRWMRRKEKMVKGKARRLAKKWNFKSIWERLKQIKGKSELGNSIADTYIVRVGRFMI